MNDFYVYAWRRPDTDVIFYVGKGFGKRANKPKVHNPHFVNVVQKLRREGFEPIVEYLAVNLTEEEAFAIECAEIAKRGRVSLGTGPLVNLTDGGDGLRGLIRTPEHNAKIAKARTGKAHSSETKEALRQARIGIPLSQDHRYAISRKQIGRKHREETKRKIAAGNLGKIVSDEQRAAISIRMVGRKLPAAHVESMRQSVLARYTDNSERLKSAVAAHKVPKYVSNTSGFKGVSYRNDRGVWRATIKVDGKSKSLGCFKTAEAAARAYDDAAYAAWGEDCYLNFPRQLMAA